MKKSFIVLTLIILLCLTFGCQQGEEVAEDMTVETGYADVNGARLYYEVAGSGEPIVFIHGLGLDRRNWDGQFEVFASSHKVIRYDVRGHGKSSIPVEGERYSHHDDLKALLEHLSVSKTHICGLSMGSAIAVDFVLAYPEMSNSLIAAGPTINGYDSPADRKIGEIFRKIISVINESGTKAAADYLITTYPETLAERLKEIFYDYSFWHFLNKDPQFILDPPALQQIDKISLPTLIITADNDFELCKEVADLLDEKIKNAVKVIIPEACHIMNMEKPDEFNRAVMDFLTKIE